MICLDQDTLRSLYPAPDPAFADRMARLTRAFPKESEGSPMKKVSLRLAVMTAALLMLLTATAVALSRPAILDWLLGHSPAGEELTRAVQEVRAEATADGIILRVTGVVCDGRNLAFAYEAEAEDPTLAAVVALDPAFTLNGQEVRFPQYIEPEPILVPTMRLDIAPVQRNPRRAGQMTGVLPELTGEVRCELTFRICRPEKAFVFLVGAEDDLRHIDDQPADYQLDLRDQLAAMRSLRNAIIPDADHQDAADWAAKGYTVEGENLRETATVTLAFTFDAGATLACDLSGTADVPLDGATMHIEQLLLSPLQTFADVRLIPQENTQEAAQALQARHGAFALTDDAGEPVEYSEMSCLTSFEPCVTEFDGQWGCRYLVEMPGLASFPESVGFVTQAGELARFDLAQGQE